MRNGTYFNQKRPHTRTLKEKQIRRSGFALEGALKLLSKRYR